MGLESGHQLIHKCCQAGLCELSAHNVVGPCFIYILLIFFLIINKILNKFIYEVLFEVSILMAIITNSTQRRDIRIPGCRITNSGLAESCGILGGESASWKISQQLNPINPAWGILIILLC